MVDFLTSQQNGMKIDMGGPNEATYFREAHDKTLFDGNAYLTRIASGMDVKDGKIIRTKDTTAPYDQVAAARKKMERRESGPAAATDEVTSTTDDPDLDMAAIDAAEAVQDAAPPTLSDEETAQVLNDKLFGRSAGTLAGLANATVYKAGKPVVKRGARV